MKKKITTVLLHATGANLNLWQDTIKFFSNNNYRVIAVDIPPFGKSKKDSSISYGLNTKSEKLNNLISKLNTKNTTLVAHSVSARLGLAMIKNNTSLYKKLVLVAPSVDFNKNQKQDVFSYALKVPFIRNYIFSTIGTNPFLTKYIFKSFFNHKK